MRRGSSRKKKNLDTQNKDGKEVVTENMLAPEAIVANFQHSLDAISKQIQSLQTEMKTDFKIFKDEITSEMKNELSEFKEDIYQKLAKVTTEMGEQGDKINAATARTEEVDKWCHTANMVIQKMAKEQKRVTDKLEDLESRSRRNNLRIYGVEEDAEATGVSMADFVEKWLKEELSVTEDLQIQRAHRALAPKPKPGQPPRSIVICFQQFTVKELIIKKAWEKKIVLFREKRVFFDHDYSEKTM